MGKILEHQGLTMRRRLAWSDGRAISTAFSIFSSDQAGGYDRIRNTKPNIDSFESYRT